MRQGGGILRTPDSPGCQDSTIVRHIPLLTDILVEYGDFFAQTLVFQGLRAILNFGGVWKHFGGVWGDY